ncbi:MAG: hypothetical protein AAF578_08495 [Pseudomonadota bacterium]
MQLEDRSKYRNYLRTPVETVLNIGWLSSEQDYSKGQVDSAIIEKFAQILVQDGAIDVHVNWERSFDKCALSGKENVFASHGGRRVWLGGSEVWLPAASGSEYFASPSLVYHYMKNHQYLPPREFLDAIEAFDLTGTYNAQKTYLQLIKGHF